MPLVAEYPRGNDHPAVRNIDAVPLARTAFDPDRRQSIGRGLGMLQLAVAAVFLICLANVVILTLATAEGASQRNSRCVLYTARAGGAFFVTRRLNTCCWVGWPVCAASQPQVRSSIC